MEVGSEAGAEVLWARWVRGDEPPSFKTLRGRVVGGHNLWPESRLPEAGWEDFAPYLDDAKAVLWVALFDEPAPKTFGESHHRRLKEAFAFEYKALSVSRYYLTIREGDLRNPLAQPDLITKLEQEFKGLRILRVTESHKDQFFAVSDERLEDLIKQCLKLLKDHGDD